MTDVLKETEKHFAELNLSDGTFERIRIWFAGVRNLVPELWIDTEHTPEYNCGFFFPIQANNGLFCAVITKNKKGFLQRFNVDLSHHQKVPETRYIIRAISRLGNGTGDIQSIPEVGASFGISCKSINPGRKAHELLEEMIEHYDGALKFYPTEEIQNVWWSPELTSLDADISPPQILLTPAEQFSNNASSEEAVKECQMRLLASPNVSNARLFGVAYLCYRFEKALYGFRALLAPWLMESIRNSPDWVTNYNHSLFYKHPDPQIRQRRSQARGSLPVLEHYYLTSCSLTDAIDQGAPLIPALADHFEVTPSTIRLLRQVDTDLKILKRKQEQHVDTMKLLARFLDLIPKSWMSLDDPHLSQSQWHAIDLLCHWDRFITDWGCIPSTWTATKVIQDYRQNWPDFCYVLQDGLISRFRDFISSFIEDVLLSPIYHRLGHVDEDMILAVRGELVSIVESLIMHQPIPKQLQHSETWHEETVHFQLTALWAAINVIASNENDGSDAAVYTWPPLSDRWTSPASGWQAIPIFDVNGLIEEGREMKHCVASYISKCLAGDAHILSIRDANNTRISTAEVNFIMGRLEARQHSGPRNVQPPAIAVQCLHDYIKAMNGGEHAINEACHADQGQDRSAVYSSDSRQKDWTKIDPALLDELFDCYRFALPKWAQKLSREAFYKETGLDHILDSIKNLEHEVPKHWSENLDDRSVVQCLFSICGAESFMR